MRQSQRWLKKLVKEGKAGSYACINGIVFFKDRSGNVVYEGIIVKNKKYELKQNSINILYKTRIECLEPYQCLPAEIEADLLSFLKGENSLEELVNAIGLKRPVINHDRNNRQPIKWILLTFLRFV
jgi:hypothetical protein